MSETLVSAPRLSTRQLLVKIPNYPCLYRHSVNGTYYAIKKHGGKRKEHSLDTTDRQIAERKLKVWLANLDKIDTEAEKTTLALLLDMFVKGRNGMSESTLATEQGIIKSLKAHFGTDLDMRVSRIRPSMLDDWLATLDLKNSSYNRYTLFVKQLFEVAIGDKMVAESPHDGLKKPWKRPETPIRLVPTDGQFRAIVENIRAQVLNANAEESANFIDFLGLAGLGQAEASRLKWGDVDWGGKRIRARRKKTGALFYLPIYAHLKPLLEKLYSRYPTPPPPNTPVFQMCNGSKALTNACKRLGFPHFTQRSIRAYLIRRLWQSGVDVKLIAKWQGHKDGGKLILSTYTEVFGDNDAEYVEAELAKVK